MTQTEKEFDRALESCEKIFNMKLRDYGASWRMMRPSSITDQLFIKAKRIRSLEEKGTSAVGEGVLDEFRAIVNYSVVGIIQLELGASDHKDMTPDEALTRYRKIVGETKALMLKKNHDYDEAWRGMRVSSYTDLILTKIERVKEIEDNAGRTSCSEGIGSNYQDMMNYAVFGIIKLTHNDR
ncbi:MAG: DUF1599 domain-containing protein [Muribaculaceae bacterium]|nr:DUF1599 domain-containing protein [Muribaculaceae bacterium]